MIISKELQSELRDKYSPDGSKLREIQLELLKILKWIDSFCNKHNITYWISSGTVLGAVRHGGFIPWDDDMDIEMPEEDYEKFCNLILEQPDCPYVLHTHSTDSNYYLQFGKLRNEKIQITETHGLDKDYKYRGIFVDLFPVTDKYNTCVQYIGGIWICLCSKLSIQCKLGAILIKTMVYPIGRYLVWPLLNLLMKRDKSEFAMRFGLGKWRKRVQKDILPTRPIRFEGIEVQGPANADAYLRNIYGDYTEFHIEHIHLVIQPTIK